MKLIYTHENRFIVANAKNILESHGIELVVRNEYTAGAMGEVSPFDTWLELWLTDDSDYERAGDILKNALSDSSAPGWTCDRCHEENGAAFELCWHCGREKQE